MVRLHIFYLFLLFYISAIFNKFNKKKYLTGKKIFHINVCTHVKENLGVLDLMTNYSNKDCKQNLVHLLPVSYWLTHKICSLYRQSQRLGSLLSQIFSFTPMLQLISWICILSQLCKGKQEVIAPSALPRTDRKKVLCRVKSFHGSNKVEWILAQVSLSSKENNIRDGFVENLFPWKTLIAFTSVSTSSILY